MLLMKKLSMFCMVFFQLRVHELEKDTEVKTSSLEEAMTTVETLTEQNR
jgi:hypothetical protein